MKRQTKINNIYENYEPCNIYYKSDYCKDYSEGYLLIVKMTMMDHH